MRGNLPGFLSWFPDPTFWDKGLDILDGMVREVERLSQA